MFKTPRKIALAATALCCGLAFSQTATAPNDGTQSVPVTANPVPQPCAQPAKTFDIHDYTGPFSKHLAGSSQPENAKTVRESDGSVQGLQPCRFDASDKFRLFVRKSSSPANFVHAGWNAGWDQLNNDDPSFGQGAEGYGKRYGAALADSTSHKFFGTFLYPSILRQDPRYYRLGDGTVNHRLGHALRHVFVAQSDSGNAMPNYSEWFGTFSYKALGNLYHPGNARGFGPVARRSGIGIATDMGWDVFREFWPEVAHKMHLPFKNRDNAAVVSH
jgi:hypothetical protein